MRMKKLIVSLLLLVFLIPSVVFADVTVYDVTVYVKTALTGSAGALDSIDGTGLVDGDLAFVFASNVFYTYRLDDDSGAAESSPSVIAPDANGGNKRWILQNTYNSSYSSISGTPAQYQWGEWVNATTIKGTAVTGSKVVCTDANGSPVACTNLTDTAVDLRGYIAGLGLSNAADADHDITIAAGTCRDSTNAYTLTLASALTKQIDAAWAAGTNAGGLDTGSVANSTFYYIFLIRKDSDGSIDALFSASATAPTMPEGYTYFRRIGALVTDGSANIRNGAWNGDTFTYNTKINDRASAALANTNRTVGTLSVPPNTTALLVLQFQTASGAGFVNLGPTTDADIAPTAATDSMYNFGTALAPSYREVRADASSQIYFRGNSTNAYIGIQTLGWIDTRGRDL